ncbi:hypothetical protein [Streptococcus sp. zg-JUN1979]|uniref:hypothetical protein n=1 Tax=Streptococcus sp. zg-JUN1979 TaxID=3391450 RepID=UPI0039A48B28
MFRKKRPSYPYNDSLVSILGDSRVVRPNFDNLYRECAPEQLTELKLVLQETIRFLEYQESLSNAFRRGDTQELQHLLENKIEGNLTSLQKDEEWLLSVRELEHKNEELWLEPPKNR